MGGMCRRIPPARNGGDEPLSRVLRRDCADLHAAIEANPHFSRVLSPDLRREDYVALLRRLLPFHGVAEAGIARHLGREAGLGLPARRRSALILTDLAWLGAGACPPGRPGFEVADRAGAWGTLYVLEGSTLGAKAILGAVGRSLGLGAEAGAAFFGAYGARTGAMWRELRAGLDAEGVARPADIPAILAGARHCFAALDRWTRG